MNTGEEVGIKLESSKTKHPQLLYESKLYRIMAGGKQAAFSSQLQLLLFYFRRSLLAWSEPVPGFSLFPFRPMQPAFPLCAGMDRKGISTLWCSICLVPAWKTCSTFATGNSRLRLSLC